MLHKCTFTRSFDVRTDFMVKRKLDSYLCLITFISYRLVLKFISEPQKYSLQETVRVSHSIRGTKYLTLKTQMYFELKKIKNKFLFLKCADVLSFLTFLVISLISFICSSVLYLHSSRYVCTFIFLK